MSFSLELACLEEIVRLELEPSQQDNEMQKEVWFIKLPFIYNETASAYFEEQLVIRLPFISRMANDTFAKQTDTRFVRARVCIAQLEERAASVIHKLQTMQTALQVAL